MNTKIQSLVAASKAGDLLVLRGNQAALLLYAPPRRNARVEISGVIINNRASVAIFQTLLAAKASFALLRRSRPPSSFPDALCIAFHLPQGGKVLFTSQPKFGPHDTKWCISKGYSRTINSPLVSTSTRT